MKKVILVAGASIVGLTSFAQSKKAENTGYGKNILRVNPINMFVNGGVGFGLGYERILTDDGKFGLKLPFHIGMDANNSYSGWGNNYQNITNYSIMFNPGIKFYPMSQRRVTYGLGFSVFGIYGSNDHYNYDNNGFSRKMDGSHTNMGMMVDNSVQFNLTPKFNIGLELGLGPSYYNSYTETVQLSNTTIKQTNTYGMEMMASFNFHMGFRF